MKEVTIAEFNKLIDKKQISVSPYNTDALEKEVALCQDISKFYPAEVYINISEYSDKRNGTLYFFEHPRVKITHPLNIRVDYSDHKKKYSFYAMKLHDLRNISHPDVTKAANEIGEPQQIGVLTLKKIQAWIDYYEKLYQVLEVKNNETADKIQSFRDSLKGQPVHWYGSLNEQQKQNRGCIEKGGLCFEFTIQDTCIDTSIKVAPGHGNSLKSFLKMADNKYIDNK